MRALIWEQDFQYRKLLEMTLREMKFPNLAIVSFGKREEAIEALSLNPNNFDLLIISTCGVVSVFGPKLGEGKAFCKPKADELKQLIMDFLEFQKNL
jgi:hypothetical protein